MSLECGVRGYRRTWRYQALIDKTEERLTGCPLTTCCSSGEEVGRIPFFRDGDGI